MTRKIQTLAIPGRMIELGAANLKREALFYDHIAIIANSDEHEDEIRNIIHRETTTFLEDNHILSFHKLQTFMTDIAPPEASELEVALVAASKVAFMSEMLSVDGVDRINTLRQLYFQSISRLAVVQLSARLLDHQIFPLDFGHRWHVDLHEDRMYDDFERLRYERPLRVDPPLNRWNYYLDLFNKSSPDSRSQALSLVLEDVAVSDSHTNWFDIIDFRESMDNDLLLGKLILKLDEALESKATIESGLKIIKSERNAYNNKLRRAIRSGRISLARSVISFSLDAIPNVIKMDFGKIFEDGFTIYESIQSNIDKMMELKSDGFYYLHRVEGAFP